ncbi:MAG: neutral zinc metallopeptidase [Nakamurella sp.]
MKFNDRARLDTSQIQDRRGGGGGGGGGFGGGLGGMLPRGGGGIGKAGGGLGLLLVIGIVVWQMLSGSGGSSTSGGPTGSGPGNVLSNMRGGASGAPAQADNSQLAANCRTGADANANSDCALVAIVNSVQDYWTAEFQQSGTTYQQAPTVWFQGNASTGCGPATSGVGPFYCPADRQVYVDLSFFQTLKTQFKANDEPFTQAYVLAHEYGHHVQNLLGTSSRVGQESGPTSGSVRLELQADCYAGVWANHASTVPDASGEVLITEITDADVRAALDAAGKIGDDYIQENLGNGTADPSSFTHGTSAQRQKWFTTGFQGGNPSQCNTFDTNDLG